MKFLLDVNASGPVGKFLITEGHDVMTVNERDVGMSDDQILQWSVNEERIIVTTDKDFEAMVWKENRQHSGILRLENLPISERKRRI